MGCFRTQGKLANARVLLITWKAACVHRISGDIPVSSSSEEALIVHVDRVQNPAALECGKFFSLQHYSECRHRCKIPLGDGMSADSPSMIYMLPLVADGMRKGVCKILDREIGFVNYISPLFPCVRKGGQGKGSN